MGSGPGFYSGVSQAMPVNNEKLYGIKEWLECASRTMESRIYYYDKLSPVTKGCVKGTFLHAKLCLACPILPQTKCAA